MAILSFVNLSLDPLYTFMKDLSCSTENSKNKKQKKIQRKHYMWHLKWQNCFHSETKDLRPTSTPKLMSSKAAEGEKDQVLSCLITSKMEGLQLKKAPPAIPSLWEALIPQGCVNMIRTRSLMTESRRLFRHLYMDGNMPYISVR